MVNGELFEDLQNFFFSRQERMLPDQLSVEYTKAREESKKHYKVIRSKLAPEFHKRLIALVDAHGRMESEVEDISYRQGFSDGIRTIMQALGTNV